MKRFSVNMKVKLTIHCTQTHRLKNFLPTCFSLLTSEDDDDYQQTCLLRFEPFWFGLETLQNKQKSILIKLKKYQFRHQKCPAPVILNFETFLFNHKIEHFCK